MTPVDPRIEPLLARMAEDPRLPKEAESSIRQALAESPYLSNLLGNAIEKGQIGAIAVSHGENNGGHFQDGKDGKAGTLNISEAAFADFSGTQRIDYLTEVMGHETMHGVLAEHRTRHWQSSEKPWAAACKKPMRTERVKSTSRGRRRCTWTQLEKMKHCPRFPACAPCMIVSSIKARRCRLTW